MLEAEDEDGAERVRRPCCSAPLPSATTSAASRSRSTRTASRRRSTSGFLLLGTEDGRRARWSTAGHGRDPRRDRRRHRASTALPDERLAYAYLSRERRRRAARREPARLALARHLRQLSGARPASPPPSASTATALDISIRSDQDPRAPTATPGLLRGAAAVRADAHGRRRRRRARLPRPRRPRSSARRLALACRQPPRRPALLSRLRRASSRHLQRDGGVSLEEDLLPLLGSEVALSVEPGRRRERPTTPGTGASARALPYVSLIADRRRRDRGRHRDLADLQAPLTEALAPRGGDGGQVAGLRDR